MSTPTRAKSKWALLVLVLAACSSDPPPVRVPTAEIPGDQVRTDAGIVRGTREGDTLAFKGIPFAAPPIGANRWKAPAPPAPWDGVRDASHFGSGCIEIDLPAGKAKQGSEDCLTLNVWTPLSTTGTASTRTPLPVLVFVHGGYNVYGSSGKTAEDRFTYSGESIATRGPAVVVTLNYRLGALGFLASRALGTKGNFALLDVAAALTWVKKNIVAFGGDASHVMLFGHSAGAVNTCALVASPIGKGLFSSAIMHSGNCIATPLDKELEGGDELVEKLGCKSDADIGACMRSKDAYAVAEAVTPHFTNGTFHWGPVIDGEVLPDQVWKLIQHGHHNHVPVIIGTTSDEMTTLYRHISTKKIESEDDEKELLHEYFGKNEEAILAQYPATTFASARDAFMTAATDGAHTCPARRSVRLFFAKQDEPVRRFFYTHVIDEGSAKAQRAGHGFDIAMLFKDGPFSYWRRTEAENKLSDAMVGYWTRFAKTGDPNGAGAVKWPETTREQDNALVLDETIRATDDVREAKCDFWDSLLK